MLDYHVHSYLSHHGEGAIFQYVEAAYSKGVTEIGFAEHIPIPGLDDPTGRMDVEEWEIYERDVRAAQKAYPDIKIRFGVEADYYPKYMPYIADFVAQQPFDFVIGSVHFIGDWDYSNPALGGRLEELGPEKLWLRYYELVLEAIRSEVFDVIGHLDLPKRLTGQVPDNHTTLVESVLLAAQDYDVALDVNTSGLRRAPWEAYPHPAVLQRAAELKLPIVMGSDAHRPDDVAAGFEETYTLLSQLGFTEQCQFVQRQRTQIPLNT